MIKKFTLILILLCLCMASAFGEEDKRFLEPVELVESVPVETIFGSPDIRTPETVWIDMINEAKKTIDLGEFYICNEKGEVLAPVIQAIEDAANRGVKVRIISDSIFYETYPETLDYLDKNENITVRIISYKKLADGVMHAKYFIIDSEDVFIGSQNFDWKAIKHIHEIGIRVRDLEFAKTILKIFDLDWFICETQDVEEALRLVTHSQSLVNSENKTNLQYRGEEISLYPAFSPEKFIYDDMDWDEDEVVKLMNNAREEILLQVLQYSPADKDKTYYQELDNAIRSAAVRGVKVKMIISNWATRKPSIDFIKSLSLVPNVEIKISNIPEWSGGFVSFARVEHCKYMAVDRDKSWIGTSNWEKSYFYNCRNLSVIVTGKTMNEDLRKIFFKDWDGPYTEKVDPLKTYEPPKIKE